LITSYDKLWPVRIVLAGIWLWLLIRGGRKGRTVALLLIPVLIICDKMSSEVLKELVVRPRPCHMIDGAMVVPETRLLVPCGPGHSFPSSHAVNNFGLATLFTCYYRKGAWGFYGWAALVALSRPAVGVHYPSDILGGAIFGTMLALLLVAVWTWIEKSLAKQRSPASSGM
jgi:undecaprenyl-diphosphatase